MNIRPSVVEYLMDDDSTVGLSLNMAGIYELKNKNETLYKMLNQVLMDGTEDIIQIMDVLYAAYLIANPDSNMEKMEFFERANSNPRYNMKIATEMITSKKK